MCALKKAIEINPNYAEAHFRLGQISLDKTLLDEAQAEFTKATDINPHYAAAFYYLGVTCFAKEDASHAINAFKKAIEIEPKNAIAHFDLGYCLCQRKAFRQCHHRICHSRQAGTG